MIAFLRGIIKGIEENQLLLDVEGIGYEVTVPSTLTRTLPPSGHEVEIHTHLHVREDCMQLYGFASSQDRTLFRLLLRMPGIGPKVALAIMDTFRGEELFGIVARGDASGLQRVPGVGSKSAQRLVLELKGKLDGLFAAPEPAGEDDAAAGRDEASQALYALGYSRQEAQAVLKKIRKSRPESVGVSDLVRDALRELGKGKEG